MSGICCAYCDEPLVNGASECPCTCPRCENERCDCTCKVDMSELVAFACAPWRKTMNVKQLERAMATRLEAMAYLLTSDDGPGVNVENGLILMEEELRAMADACGRTRLSL